MPIDLLSLPAELLTAIGTFLYVPDIENYANSRLAISRCCLERAAQHRAFLTFAGNRRWRDTRPPESRSSAEPEWRIDPTDWKDFLILLLERPLLSHYIKDIRFGSEEDEDEETPIVFSLHDCSLVRKALAACSCISEDDLLYRDLWQATRQNKRIYPDVVTGYHLQWHVLILILALLPNVEELELSGRCDTMSGTPTSVMLSKNLVRNVHEATSRNGPSLLLPYLRILSCFDGPQSIAIPLLSLPTVKAAAMAHYDLNEAHAVDCTYSDTHRLPKSGVQSLWSPEDVSAGEVLAIADRMRGPCHLSFGPRKVRIPAEHAPQDTWEQWIDPSWNDDD